jgi:predicted metal-dependent hydrolase
VQGEIEYGEKTIPYNLTYSNRKTMAIAVYPDQTVWVTAPARAGIEKIEGKIRKRARWIEKQKRRFSRFEQGNNNFEYVSGETHLYLGRRYLLRVNQVPADTSETVKMKGRYIHIDTHDKSNPDRVSKLLSEWYREHAGAKFSERFDYCSSCLKKYDIEPSGFKLYRMEKRWGSYSGDGKILLNPELIKHPPYCIDYVIIHELCHMKYPNHDSSFYRLLDRVLPDWQKRKHKLEGYKG